MDMSFESLNLRLYIDISLIESVYKHKSLIKELHNQTGQVSGHVTVGPILELKYYVIRVFLLTHYLII